MKSRWIVVLLVASLALNAGALAGFGYLTLRHWHKEREFFRGIGDRAVRQQLRALFREHEPKMDSLRNEYWQARLELGELALEKNPDPKRVEAALDRIALLHKEMNRLAFQAGTRLWELAPPERRQRLQRRWREMMGRPRRPGRHLFRPRR